MSTDGLSSLIAQREKASSKTSSSRHLPPARNAPKKPVSTQKETPATTRQETPPQPAPTTKNASPVAQVASPETEKQLIRATVYMLPSDDEWLQTVSQEARSRRPRVDASRSAVSRLALARLQETLSVEEIVDILQERAATSSQVNGRKRL